jgi:hypothetical protein
MCHRIYKSVVPATNKRNISRDLTVYESIMQALCFISEGWDDPGHPCIGKGLQDLINHSLFDCLYFRPDHKLEPDRNKETHSNLICDATVSDIQLLGQKWTSTQSCQQGLPQSPLTNLQAGELGDAYSEQGDLTLKSSRDVSYYNGVSYKIQGVDVCDGRGVWKEVGWVKVTVRVGDILEVFLEVGTQHFVKVLGVMRHSNSVFFVISWLSPTGQHHPHLRLFEYKQEPLFAHATFFSLKTVDHPRHVNKVTFHMVDNSKFLRNDWVFDVV